jgi:hypothetical protein
VFLTCGLPARKPDAFRQVLLFEFAPDGILPGVVRPPSIHHPQGEGTVAYQPKQRGSPLSICSVIRLMEARSDRIATICAAAAGHHACRVQFRARQPDRKDCC